MAPIEILSIPVLDIFLIFFRLALPEYSVSYLFLQSFRHFLNCLLFMLSNKILLNLRPIT